MKQFTKRLNDKNLTAATQEKYAEIIESAEGQNLVDWVRQKAAQNVSVGTFLPMRAAVKHYLASEHGYSLDEIEAILPPATGLPNAHRQALDYTQLADFHAATEQITHVPVRVLLTLLPMTGLKISEACELRVDDVLFAEARMVLSASKNRSVPLTRKALSVLKQQTPSDTLYFDGVTPHTVRKYTRKIASTAPSLSSLSPEVLRATFAVMSLKNGMTLGELQQVLGHESIVNTRRFLEQVVADER